MTRFTGLIDEDREPELRNDPYYKRQQGIMRGILADIPGGFVDIAALGLDYLAQGAESLLPKSASNLLGITTFRESMKEPVYGSAHFEKALEEVGILGPSTNTNEELMYRLAGGFLDGTPGAAGTTRRIAGNRGQDATNLLYSPLEKGLADLKDKSPRTPGAWKNVLSKIKGREMPFIGVDDYLAALPQNEKIPIEDVEKYLTDNRLSIIETQKYLPNVELPEELALYIGKEATSGVYYNTLPEELADWMGEHVPIDVAPFDMTTRGNDVPWGFRDPEGDLVSEDDMEGLASLIDELAETNPLPKIGPGHGPFTGADIIDLIKNETVPELNKRLRRFADQYKTPGWAHQPGQFRYRGEGEIGDDPIPDETYRDMILYMPEKGVLHFDLNKDNRVEYDPNYQGPASHYPEKNILTHQRFSFKTLPNGERVMLVEEVQSDWAFEGAQKGFRLYPDEADEYKKILEDEGFVFVPSSTALRGPDGQQGYYTTRDELDRFEREMDMKDEFEGDEIEPFHDRSDFDTDEEFELSEMRSWLMKRIKNDAGLDDNFNVVDEQKFSDSFADLKSFFGDYIRRLDADGEVVHMDDFTEDQMLEIGVDDFEDAFDQFSEQMYGNYGEEGMFDLEQITNFAKEWNRPATEAKINSLRAPKSLDPSSDPIADVQMFTDFMQENNGITQRLDREYNISIDYRPTTGRFKMEGQHHTEDTSFTIYDDGGEHDQISSYLDEYFAFSPEDQARAEEEIRSSFEILENQFHARRAGVEDIFEDYGIDPILGTSPPRFRMFGEGQDMLEFDEESINRVYANAEQGSELLNFLSQTTGNPDADEVRRMADSIREGVNRFNASMGFSEVEQALPVMSRFYDYLPEDYVIQQRGDQFVVQYPDGRTDNPFVFDTEEGAIAHAIDVNADDTNINTFTERYNADHVDLSSGANDVDGILGQGTYSQMMSIADRSDLVTDQQMGDFADATAIFSYDGAGNPKALLGWEHDGRSALEDMMKNVQKDEDRISSHVAALEELGIRWTGGLTHSQGDTYADFEAVTRGATEIDGGSITFNASDVIFGNSDTMPDMIDIVMENIGNRQPRDEVESGINKIFYDLQDLSTKYHGGMPPQNYSNYKSSKIPEVRAKYVEPIKPVNPDQMSEKAQKAAKAFARAGNTPKGPFVSDPNNPEWINLAAKRLTQIASENNADRIMFVPARSQTERWSSLSPEKADFIYDKKFPSYLQKLERQYGEGNKIEESNIEFPSKDEFGRQTRITENFPGIRLSPKLKETVKKGLPYLAVPMIGAAAQRERRGLISE